MKKKLPVSLLLLDICLVILTTVIVIEFISQIIF